MFDYEISWKWSIFAYDRHRPARIWLELWSKSMYCNECINLCSRLCAVHAPIRSPLLFKTTKNMMNCLSSSFEHTITAAHHHHVCVAVWSASQCLIHSDIHFNLFIPFVIDKDKPQHVFVRCGSAEYAE